MKWPGDPDCLHPQQSYRPFYGLDAEGYEPRPTSRILDPGLHDETDAEDSDQTRRTLSPPPRLIPTQDQQEIIDEISDREAYYGLIALGGRPSHPCPSLTQPWDSSSVYTDLGKHRDIVAFWQDKPWERNLFARQLEKWMQFRRHWQTSSRKSPETFQHHVEDTRTTLERHGFFYPPWFTPTEPFFFQENPRDQDILATWFEYLYSRCVRQEDAQRLQDSLRPEYEEAAKVLLKKLGQEDMDESSIDPLYGSISTAEIAQAMYERRRLQREEIDQHDKHWDSIAAFQHSTHQYSQMRTKVDRLKILLAWTHEQVEILIEEKANELGIGKVEAPAAQVKKAISEAPGPAQLEKPIKGRVHIPAASDNNSHHCHLMRLPAEIRKMIWEDCLPKGPTAHFFEVVERQRKGHMLHYWSPEFRTCASRDFPSGYLAVYPLLAACRDSREFTVNFYRRRQQRFYQAYGLEWGKQEQSQWQNTFGNALFETFHWIPGDDLVMLCFPPRQVARLPKHHAVTFAPNPPRQVGIFLDEPTYLVEKWGAHYEGGRDQGPLPEGRSREKYLKLLRPPVNDADQVATRIHTALDLLRILQPHQNLRDYIRIPSAKREPVLGGIRRIQVFVNGTAASPYPHTRGYYVAARDGETSYRFGGPRQGGEDELNENTLPRSYWYLAVSGCSRTGPVLNDQQFASRAPWCTEWVPRKKYDLILQAFRESDIVERPPFSTIGSFARRIREGCIRCGWPEFTPGGQATSVLGITFINTP